jgi:hypothetical protein
VLALLAIALLVVFGADTHALIPLYAVGVFLSFSLSQFGMVRYWKKRPSPVARRSMLLNFIGGAGTTIVLLVQATTKFVDGAWIVIVLIPMFVWMLKGIRLHYDQVARQLALTSGEPMPESVPHVVVLPVSEVHKGVLSALKYARSVAADVVAVTVEINPDATARLKDIWKTWGSDTPLVVLPSPYRSLLDPIIDYIRRLREQRPGEFITVVVPEFIPAKWYQHILHNQSAFMLRAALLFEPGVVVTSIRLHLH